MQTQTASYVPTPVQQCGPYWAKRDDLFEVAGVRGGKARTCLELAVLARECGYKGLTTASSRKSPQVSIVAHVAQYLGMAARIHVPAARGKLTPEIADAQQHGADILFHPYGHNSVIISRAKRDASEHGYFYIPFGMECVAAVVYTGEQVANLVGVPFRRIVVPVGSGMSLAGILHGLIRYRIAVPVLGITVGADPRKRLQRYAPFHWASMVKLVPSQLDYGWAVADQPEWPYFPLDEIYERKCLPYLQDGDLLWVVGIRTSQG